MPASASLYDVLGVPATAPPEEIRKAYRRRALQTHPDRIGPNASADDKQKAEDSFRKVNAAYEVLNDPANRKLYDQHGVWPPPEPAAEDDRPHRQRHRSFSGSSRHHSRTHRQSPPPPGFPDPFAGFFDTPFYHPHPYVFTDPFELFRRVFDNDPFFARDPFFAHDPFLTQAGPFSRASPFDRADRMFDHADRMLAAAFADPFLQPLGDTRGISSHTSSFSSRTGGAGERHIKTITNGRVEEVHERWDGQGNHYVTRTRDGKTTHTVNGIEGIEGPKAVPPPPSSPANLPPPPPYAPPPLSASSSRRHRRESQPVPPPPPPPPPPSYAYPDYARHPRPFGTPPPPPLPPSVPNAPPPMAYDEHHRKKHWWNRLK
ncbi:DnaJ-domain-containing protein [Exidia glandulosa HHB12029]|uniref:DnaJ-domain-containing protein n=1 Tax=Exidia glandulosa HHB12029 TaxID=1314781 RepID=A0A165HRV4_EXIGL|nr:DnaJ-domain-containing protein [Exidia glandulosa HHB12029]